MFHKKKIVFALLIALLLSIVGYFVNNSPYFAGENLDRFYFGQLLRNRIFNSKTEEPVAFIDISCDKMVTERVEGFYERDTIGKVAIADRQKLATFLKLLQKSDAYEFIIIDLGLDASEPTTYDDELFSAIAEMRDIVVVDMEENSAVPDSLSSKTAVSYSDFRKSFTRYEFIKQDGLKSLPLKVFEELYPKKAIKAHGLNALPFYTSSGKLCQKACFVTMPDYAMQNTGSKHVAEALNGTRMGHTYLRFLDIKGEEFVVDKITEATKEKFVVICDLQNDQQQTYCGDVPGAYVVWRALVSLLEGRNLVSFWNLFCWFLLYFVMSWCILANISLKDLIPSSKKHNHKFLYFIIDNLSYPILLGIATYIEFRSGHMVHSILLPWLVMGTLKLYVSLHNYDE